MNDEPMIRTIGNLAMARSFLGQIPTFGDSIGPMVSKAQLSVAHRILATAIDDINRLVESNARLVIRTLPIGGGANILCGRRGYEREMAFRRERIRAGVPYDLPAWESLKVYFPQPATA